MANLDSITSIVAKHPKAAAKALAKMGKGEDTVLAHLEPWEAKLLDRKTDGKTINKRTGLPAFEDGMGGDSNPGGGHNADGPGGNPGGGGSGGGTSGSSGGGTSSGGSDQNGVSASGGYTSDYAGAMGYGFSTPDPSYSGISNFGGIGQPGSGSIGPGGDMSNFAGSVGSLTDAGNAASAGTTSLSFSPAAPAPAPAYDPLSSPVKEAPQRPAVRQAVDNFNNTIGKITSLRQEVQANPATNLNQARNYMDISPMSVIGGLLTGMPVGHMMDAFGYKDPYSMSLDLGFGDEKASSTNPDRDGDGYSDSASSGSQTDHFNASNSAANAAAGRVALTNPGTITPATPGSSYVAPSPLSAVTPVGQTKLRARRGLVGDYAPNFRTSAI